MNEPFLKAKICIEGKRVPLNFVSIQHPLVQNAEYQGRVLTWAGLYGIIRRHKVAEILSTESVPLYIVVVFTDGEEWGFQMSMDEWYEMGPYIIPVDGPVNWSREGF